MGVKKKVKVKPSPKTGSLLAKIKNVVGQALKKKLQAQMESLPQVDVPVTATPVGSGPPHPPKVSPKYLDALNAGQAEILKNTVHNPGNFIDMSPEAFEAFKSAMGEKLTEIEGMPTPVKVHLEKAKALTDMEKVAVTDLKKFLNCGAQVVTDVKDVKLVDIAGLPTLTGKASLSQPVGGDYSKDETPDLSYTEADLKAVQANLKKFVGYKAEDFIPFMAPILPSSKVIPTGMSLSDVQKEFEDWSYNTVKGVLDYLKHKPCDSQSFSVARNMVEQHYVDTLQSGGVGPPALFKTLPKEAIIHRVGLRLGESLNVLHGQLTPEQTEVFQEVFPTCGPPKHRVSSSVLVTSPIVTLNEVVGWMQGVAKIIFDFIHWQPLTKELLLAVRKYIEEVYDEDLVPKLPEGFDAVKKLPKEGVVFHTAQRVWHLIFDQDGEVFGLDEAAEFFVEVFPLPCTNDNEAMGEIGSLMGSSSPSPTAFVENQEELEAAFGKPDPSNPMNKHVAIMLQKTHEYMKAHPEAAGVGPLDGGGIVQTLAPFSATPNQNGNFYSKDLWDKVVKKLQPKFSKEAEADAKAQGLSMGSAEEIISAHTESPGMSPSMEVTVVLEGDTVYLVTSSNGKVVSKKPIHGASEEITPKGLATLNRFGVVLAAEPKPAHTSPGVYVKELDLKHLVKHFVPPMPAEHIELNLMVEKNKAKP